LTTTILALAVAGMILAFIYWRLYVTDTEIQAQDSYVSEREALRVRLENDMPIK